MKALVYYGPHQLGWDEWPDPQAGDGEVIIAVRAVGICGSDIHGYTGASDRRRPPMVMGHEVAGDVIELGSGVSRNFLGKRVIIRPNILCGTCEKCKTGNSNLCINRKMIGVNIPGAMAERISVPVENLIPLSDTIDYISATLIEPLAVGIRAVNQAGEISGKSVLIAGSGPIGLFTLLAARMAGARYVVTTDIIPKRRELALLMGSNASLDPSQDDWKVKLCEAIGQGVVDVTFDAVGIQPTFEQALDMVNISGTMIAIGGWQVVKIHLGKIVGREIHLTGSLNYTPEEFSLAHQWLKDQVFDPHLLITNIYPLDEGVNAFKTIAQRQDETIKSIFIFGGW